jgi:hypothetical protein
MKLLNVACNITKEGSPLEARTEEIFFCLLTMLTQWVEIISAMKENIKMVRIKTIKFSHPSIH